MADKQSFELKAHHNSFETGADDGGLIRIEDGDVYTTSNANDIANLSRSDALKSAETPDGARAGSKTTEKGGK